MSKKSLVRWVVLSAAMVAASALRSSLVAAADPGPLTARMDAFSSPDGASISRSA